MIRCYKLQIILKGNGYCLVSLCYGCPKKHGFIEFFEAFEQAEGSKLSLESKENFGSTFYFDLPIRVKEAAHHF